LSVTKKAKYFLRLDPSCLFIVAVSEGALALAGSQSIRYALKMMIGYFMNCHYFEVIIINE